MRKIIFIALAALFTLASCIDPNDIAIKGIGAYNMKSLSEMEVGLIVENNSNRNITIEEIEINIVDKSDITHPIVNIKNSGEVIIRKKTTEEATIPFSVEIVDMNRVLAIGINSFIAKWSDGGKPKMEYRAVGYIKVKGAGLKNRFKIDYPIDQEMIERLEDSFK